MSGSNPLARLVDEQAPPAGLAEGFVAERHPSFPEIILVWAPCSCVWICSPGQQPFVTYCRKEDCRFEWRSVDEAIRLLKHAEELAKNAIPDVASNVAGDTPDAGLSTGGGPPGASEALPETPAPLVGPVQTVEDSQVSDMISEGGPDA